MNFLKDLALEFIKKSLLSFILIVIVAVAIFAFASAGEKGCVESDEFDTQPVTVKSNPVEDGVFGTYNDSDGGQRANWHDTGLLSNGEKFVIQVAGGWISWGNSVNPKICTDTSNNFTNWMMCARKSGVENCLCYPGQTSVPEIGSNGRQVEANCISNDQNDPRKCTCTKTAGSAFDDNVYHIQLGNQNKFGELKTADLQRECKFDKGMGLYLGLFGAGNSVPSRVYHLFTLNKVCNLVPNSNGQCLDGSGRDVTKYIFTSANNRIFMKDDGDGNTGINTNTANDQYHAPNEAVKLIIYDRYYEDNEGQYDLIFMKGVNRQAPVGLLEYIVKMVEDVLMGEINSSGNREGGIIEFMYKSIVSDSNFILIVRAMLVLYVAFTGIAYTMGLLGDAWTRKEIISRSMKVALIGLFTSSESWYFYDHIIVSFFKDSMDYVVAMMMSTFDSNVEPTSSIMVSQMQREISLSSATRFSYVDLIIIKLFSMGTAKKIGGLLFSASFGILYITIFYLLVFFFIWVMLHAMVFYLLNLVRLIFILSLGPVFIPLSLFSKTKGIFDKWIGFLGGRSLEVVFLFAILYMFITEIDRRFTDLLSYRVCGEVVNFGLFSLSFLKADISRSSLEWFSSFVMIAGFIYFMKLIMDQIPTIVGNLVTIGGVAAKDGDGNPYSKGVYARSDPKNPMGAADLISQGIGKAVGAFNTVLPYAMKYGSMAAQGTGRLTGISAALDKIPFRSPRNLARDDIIDKILTSTQNGFKGDKFSAKAMEEARNKAIAYTQAKKEEFAGLKDANKIAAAVAAREREVALKGITEDRINKRLEALFIAQPLKEHIAAESKKLKESGEFGRSLEEKLRQSGHDWMKKMGHTDEMAKKYLGMSKDDREAWAKRNHLDVKNAQEQEDWKRANMQFGGTSDDFKDYFSKEDRKGSLGDFISGEVNSDSSATIAKRLIGKTDLQEKYMAFLKEREFEKEQQSKEKSSAGKLSAATNFVSEKVRGFRRKVKDNPKIAQKNFMRHLHYEEKRGKGLLDKIGINTGKSFLQRVRLLDNNPEIASRKKDVELRMLRKSLSDQSDQSRLLTSQKKDFLERSLKELAVKDFQKDFDALAKLRRSSTDKKAIAEAEERLASSISGHFSKNDLTLLEKSAISEAAVRVAGVRVDETLAKMMRGKLSAERSAIKSSQKEFGKFVAKVKQFERGKENESGNILEMVKELSAMSGELRDNLQNKIPQHPLGREEEEIFSGILEGRRKMCSNFDKAARSLQNLEGAIENGANQESLKVGIDAALEELNSLIAQERARFTEEKLTIDLKLENTEEAVAKAMFEEVSTRVDAASARLDEANAIIKNSSSTDAQKAEANAILQESKALAKELEPSSQGLIATDFKVEFGASITDVLLKESNIGLKASNVLLGVSDDDKSFANQKLLSGLKTEEMQVGCKLKMAELNKKIKEFEINQLKANPELKNKTDLQQQLKTLEDDFSVLEREVSKFEREIKSIEKEVRQLGA